MAGQASNPVPGMTAHHPLEKPVVVIGPQFLTQCPVQLTIANDFGVTDVHGTPIFSVKKIKSKSMSIHGLRHLEDAAGNILVTLKPKIRTMHERTQVFRGESTEEKDLLFSVKKSSLMQKRTQLDVFLASDTSESVPDFKVKGSSIYLGDGESNVTVAEMFKRDNFKTIKVSPNVDQAFIVALVMALDEINANRGSQVMAKAGKAVGKAAAGVVGEVATVAAAAAVGTYVSNSSDP